MTRVVLIGDINIDVLMSIPHYPDPGEDAMAEGVTLRPGGSVANTAIVLSKLGMKAQMIARTGEDLWAELALAAIASQGVDTSLIHRDPTRTTGFIFIPVTEDGERTMFSYRGANVHLRPEDLREGLFEDIQLLHISGYNFLVSPQREATLLAVARAVANGIPLSLDIGVEPAREAREDLLELMPRLSLCVLGGEEARALLGTATPQDAAANLLGRGVRRVGYKLGSAGCLVADSSSEHLLPGFEVDTVDTTGAGDAFCAGFIYAWMKGFALPATGILANAMGALATSVWGAGPALLGRSEAIDLLQQQGSILQQAGYLEPLKMVQQTLEEPATHAN